jgi:hypothetical protein
MRTVVCAKLVAVLLRLCAWIRPALRPALANVDSTVSLCRNDSLLKLLTLVCSAQILLRGYAESRAQGALGVRLGNWLSAQQGCLLVSAAEGAGLRAICRTGEILALLLGCGLWRAERR